MKFSKIFPVLLIGIVIASFLLGNGLVFALGSFVLGGVILQGILGGVSGKVGGVVGGKWKDVNYLRGYAIPENPNTAAQQIQRSRMAQGVYIARQLLGDLIQPFWDPFYSSMSGFNAWISENIMKLTSGDYYLDTTAVMAKGNVLGLINFSATYDTANGNVSLVWGENSNGSTGLSSDYFNVVVAQPDGKIHIFETELGTRYDEGNSTSIDSGLTASDLLVYGFFSRGTGSAVEVSDSSGVVPSAA